jgi:hypothetical protein
MCMYCNMGDHAWQTNPPWTQPYGPIPDPSRPWHPALPQPLPGSPIQPWPLENLKEFQDILKRLKALEDKMACECEPKEVDYIALIQQRIDALEKITADKP